MTFLTFEYFLALAESDSVRSAAEKLRVSQQSLSEQLRRLEEELGVTLITRTRPLSLTPCGAYFAEFSAQMLREKKDMERKLAELSGSRKEIILSLSPDYCPPSLPDSIAAFEAQHPGCSVTLVRRSAQPTQQELEDADLHISSSPLPGDLESMYIEIPHTLEDLSDTFNSNELSVVVQEDLLRWKWKDEFEARFQQLLTAPSLSLLQKIPFIRTETPPHGSTMDRLFIENGFSPDVVINAGSREMSMQLCRIGAGATLMPKGAAMQDLPDLLLIPLHGAWPAPATILSYRKGKNLTPEEQALIAAILNGFSPGTPL